MKTVVIILALLTGLLFSLGLSVMSALATYDATYDKIKKNKQETVIESLKVLVRSFFLYSCIFIILVILLNYFILS